MKTTSKMKATKKMNKTWKMMMTSKVKVSLKNEDMPLPMHTQTEKMTFSCKDDCTLMKHTRRWTYRQRSDYCRRAVIFDSIIPSMRKIDDVGKNDRTAAVVRASPICSAPCVLHQYTVVFAWKWRLFSLYAHGQCRVYYIYHVEFHFRFGHLVSFPV